MVLRMKIEQKIVAVYSIIGLLCGIFSNYLTPINLTLALLVPAAVYFATLMPLIRVVKERKFRTLLSNSIITFFLIWIITWVFLYNL